MQYNIRNGDAGLSRRSSTFYFSPYSSAHMQLFDNAIPFNGGATSTYAPVRSYYAPQDITFPTNKYRCNCSQSSPGYAAIRNEPTQFTININVCPQLTPPSSTSTESSPLSISDFVDNNDLTPLEFENHILTKIIPPLDSLPHLQSEGFICPQGNVNTHKPTMDDLEEDIFSDERARVNEIKEELKEFLVFNPE
ncbi:hypothetical protein JTB14_017379 [Gonioctena quinquepunctata]|nr:hypothetical protein JTB14_017379 [Gonioctena quinquepunctata]